MKTIKILIIALMATFAFSTVNAQTTAPAKKATTEKMHKKGHKKHHHKKHTKMAPAKM